MLTKLTKKKAAEVTHFYKQYRVDKDGYMRPALEAWLSARRQVYFREWLAETNRKAKKRSKAAKNGWKTRRLKMAA